LKRILVEVEDLELAADIAALRSAATSDTMASHDCLAAPDAGFPWLESAMLAIEACEVIGLRLAMFATADDKAEREAQLMVSEKVDAMFEAGASLMAGATPAAIIGRYREHVAANAQRLSI
jgi:hypothetical protein